MDKDRVPRTEEDMAEEAQMLSKYFTNTENGKEQ